MASALETLNSIVQSIEFRQMPTQDAIGAGPVPWEQAMELLAASAARQQLCQAGHYIALLFDTYGPLIKTVSLEVVVSSTGTGQGRTIMMTSLVLNGVCTWVCAALDMEEWWGEAMEAVDGQTVYRAVMTVLEGMRNSHLIPQADTWREAFSKPIVSAAEAREMARQWAPAADAWLCKQILDQALPVVADSPRRAPRV